MLEIPKVTEKKRKVMKVNGKVLKQVMKMTGCWKSLPYTVDRKCPSLKELKWRKTMKEKQDALSRPRKHTLWSKSRTRVDCKGIEVKSEVVQTPRGMSICKKFIFKVRTGRTEVEKFQVLEKGLCRPANTGRVPWIQVVFSAQQILNVIFMYYLSNSNSSKCNKLIYDEK
ncbi:hypothetical protein LXL04_025542 [Taraxacum kok-saghyz]